MPRTNPADRSTRPGRSPVPAGPGLVLAGRIGPGDVVRLEDVLERVIDGTDSNTVVCDVRGIEQPDAGTVDALARLALMAHRRGTRLVLAGPAPTLRELLAFAGLTRVLRAAPPSVFQRERQPEEREVARDVKEERDTADPAVGDLHHLQ